MDREETPDERIRKGIIAKDPAVVQEVTNAIFDMLGEKTKDRSIRSIIGAPNKAKEQMFAIYTSTQLGIIRLTMIKDKTSYRNNTLESILKLCDKQFNFFRDTYIGEERIKKELLENVKEEIQQLIDKLLNAAPDKEESTDKKAITKNQVDQKQKNQKEYPPKPHINLAPGELDRFLHASYSAFTTKIRNPKNDIKEMSINGFKIFCKSNLFNIGEIKTR